MGKELAEEGTRLGVVVEMVAGCRVELAAIIWPFCSNRNCGTCSPTTLGPLVRGAPTAGVLVPLTSNGTVISLGFCAGCTVFAFDWMSFCSLTTSSLSFWILSSWASDSASDSHSSTSCPGLSLVWVVVDTSSAGPISLTFEAAGLQVSSYKIW